MFNLDLLNLKSRKIIITGAASGIGRITSIELSKLGADLLLLDINKEELEKTATLCPGHTKLLQFDLIRIKDLKEELIQAVRDFGKLNGIVHLAGVPYISPLKSLNIDRTIDVFLINTYSGVELAKIFANRQVYSGSQGSIVFISSIYGLRGSAANVGYSMSKAALHGATRSLAIELAEKDIRVNCIAPGFIKTAMLDSVSESFDENYLTVLKDFHPLGLGEPLDISNAIIFLISDMSKWITGSILSVDGGFTAK